MRLSNPLLPTSKFLSTAFALGLGLLLGSSLALTSCSSDSNMNTDSTGSISLATATSATQTNEKPNSRAVSSNLRSQDSTGLYFTVDQFKRGSNLLAELESLGEYKQTEKFCCNFKDGSGIVTGEYLKSSRNIERLTITGRGQAWLKLADLAISLSTPNPKVADQVKAKLKLTEERVPESSITEGQFSFSAGDFMGKNLLVIRIGSALAKRQLPLDNPYIAPTVNVDIATFKARFNRRISVIAPQLRITGPGEETTSPAYFCYPFTKTTILHVYANDNMNIEKVDLDTVAADAEIFWSCADAAVTALNSTLSKSEVDAILQRLGMRTGKRLSDVSLDLEEGGLLYGYYPDNKDCMLHIQPNEF